MKKVLAIVLTAIVLTGAVASASSLLKANAEYEGFGLVDLDLNWDASWAEPQVAVTDTNGNALDTQIFKYDEDDVNFWIPDLTEDQVYSGTVSDPSSGDSAAFEFYASSLLSEMIRKVEYDAEDRELDIEFAMDVEFQSPAVTVTDANGTQYETRIAEKDEDGLEVRVKGLTRGATYTLTVTGVKGRTFDTFETYTTDFVARDD